MVKSITFEMAKTMELGPEVYIMKDKKISIAMLVLAKPAWRAMVAKLVNAMKADYYVFTDENWWVHADKMIPGVAVKDNPAKQEMVTVYGYSRDGKTKSAAALIDKERKLLEIPEEESVMLDFVIGDVFEHEGSAG